MWDDVIDFYLKLAYSLKWHAWVSLVFIHIVLDFSAKLLEYPAYCYPGISQFAHTSIDRSSSAGILVILGLRFDPKAVIWNHKTGDCFTYHRQTWICFSNTFNFISMVQMQIFMEIDRDASYGY